MVQSSVCDDIAWYANVFRLEVSLRLVCGAVLSCLHTVVLLHSIESDDFMLLERGHSLARYALLSRVTSTKQGGVAVGFGPPSLSAQSMLRTLGTRPKFAWVTTSGLVPPTSQMLGVLVVRSLQD